MNDLGELVFSLYLDYNPSALFVTKTTQTAVHYIVTNHLNSLMFYENDQLRWSAHGSYTATAFGVGTMRSLRGGIILMASDGQLSISYLGTDPTVFSVAPPTAARDIKWDEYDREMKSLDEKIKEKSKPIGSSTSKALQTEEEVSMKAQISKSDMIAVARSAKIRVPGTVVVSVKRSAVDDVRVHISSQDPISVEPSSSKIGRLDSSSPATIKFMVTIDTSKPCAGLAIKFAASYLVKESARLTILEQDLPLQCFCKPHNYDSNTKPTNDPNAACKVTIDSSVVPVPVAELFPDLTSQDSNEYVVTKVAGESVAILASKNSSLLFTC